MTWAGSFTVVYGGPDIRCGLIETTNEPIHFRRPARGVRGPGPQAARRGRHARRRPLCSV